MKELISSAGYYRIKVIPQQRKTEFRGEMGDGTIKIAVKSAPEKGKANSELLKFLIKELNLTSDNIRLVAGHTSRLKVVDIQLSK